MYNVLLTMVAKSVGDSALSAMQRAMIGPTRQMRQPNQLQKGDKL